MKIVDCRSHWHIYCDRTINVDNKTVHEIPNRSSLVEYLKCLLKYDGMAEYDEPFFVFNLSTIVDQHERWVRLMPRVDPFYSVKCNDHPVVLRILASVGCHFDCAGKTEIDTLLDMGVTADRILYAHPFKSIASIKHAKQRGVPAMMFDTEQEMRKIVEIFPEAELILRLAVSDPTALWCLNKKFGCDPDKDAPKLLKLAASLGANITGLCFHIGSGCRDPSFINVGLAHCRRLFDLGEKIGLKLQLLDVGGGYAGSDEEVGHPTFEQMADIVNKGLDEYFPYEQNKHVRIVAEPGRYYVASAFLHCSTVKAKLKVSADRITKNAKNSDQAGFMYHITDGRHGALRTAVYEGLKAEPLDPFADDTPLYPTIIWGPTLDDSDVLHDNIMFPELNEGDRVIIRNSGAYTSVLACHFHGFPMAKFILVAEQRNYQQLKELCVETLAEYTSSSSITNGYQNGFATKH